jgi:hypothetical protein
MEVYLYAFLIAVTGGSGYAVLRLREKSRGAGVDAVEKSVLLTLKIEPYYLVVEAIDHHCTDRAVADP